MKKRLAVLLIIALIIAAIFAVRAETDDQLVTCWAMCKPGSRVTIRRNPDKDSAETGYLECGDDFRTDAESRNGWIRCYGAGEGGWVYQGYVVTEPVEKIGEQYVCVAKRQVACRRWMGGPQIVVNGKKQWLKNGENVDVFCMSDGWAVTSRGYIKAEWLEVDPK